MEILNSPARQTKRSARALVTAPVLVLEGDPHERSIIARTLRQLFDARVGDDEHCGQRHNGAGSSGKETLADHIPVVGLTVCSSMDEAHRHFEHAAANHEPFAVFFVGMTPINNGAISSCRQDFDALLRAARDTHVVLIGEPPASSSSVVAAHLRRPVRAHELLALARTLMCDHARRNDRLYIQAMLASAQRVGDFGHWCWHLDSSTVSWSESLASLVGLGEARVDVQIDQFWHCVHVEDRERVLAHMVSVGDGIGYGTLTYRIVHPRDGIRRVRQESVLVERGSNGALLVSAVRDVTGSEGMEDTIRKLAFFDPLTELPNRSFLYEHLRGVVQHARRHERMVAVVHVDLDCFKRVNSTLGHSAGDQLLREVAERLLGCVRDSDCVVRDQGGELWPRVTVADAVTRFGADEFIIVLSEVADAADPQHVAERVLACLREPVDLNGRDVTVGASIGIAVYPSHAANEDALLRNAALAMQHAKRTGRNTFACFNDTFATIGVARLNLEADLRRALKDGGLSMHYQPKVDVRTGVTEGAEALLRWRHPQIGMVPPTEFIPIAEETGLVLPLGEWVIREVCEQMAAWTRDGLQTVPVSVNVSVHQLYDDQLIAKIRRQLDAAGLTPRELEFEITESVLMEDTGVAEARLRELRAMGSRVSMDDFGTGYSSLSYLKRLPIDVVKIDRAFVRDILSDADDQAILAAIITMAHQLRLQIVAEGVESEAQSQLLRRMDCDLIQGYVITRPLPAEQYAARFLNKQRRLAS
ncbi:MAG: putative signal transduction protein with EAL and GGDEF domain/PAS domain-containing protein [Gammaproteobacteria bacterium]|jgi:predicted signal transduction protein with EAL and GGDEF domain/PAS domain-containing protein